MSSWSWPKDGLDPRPVAQTTKHYFLNQLETIAPNLDFTCVLVLPTANLLACLTTGFRPARLWSSDPLRRAQTLWPASFVQSFFFAPSCILLLVRPPLMDGPGLRATAPTICNLFFDAFPLLSAGVGGYMDRYWCALVIWL